jgi:hypothetical protein
MTFSNTPMISTYSSQRIPAFYPISRRTASSAVFSELDEGTINLFPGKDSNTQEPYMESRPALAVTEVVNAAAVGRGHYVWEKSTGSIYYFMVAGTGVYTSTDGKTWTLVVTLLTNVLTPVGFVEHIDGTNTKKLVLVDGVEGYVFTSNAAGTKIVSANFPTPHVPNPIYMDGYIFLAKDNTGDIYNSNLNNPALWTAGDFISSELYPDNVKALVKVNNYLLVIGTEGCEFFYDAANPTASPLARHEGSIPFGTQVASSVASSKNTVMFLANNNDGEQIFKYIDGFRAKDIKASFLLQYLNVLLATDAAYTSAYIRGYFLRQYGSLIYCINLNVTGTTKSWAYSFEFDCWTELRTGPTGVFSPSSPQYSFPVCFATGGSCENFTNFVSGTMFNGTNNTPFFGTTGLSRFSGTTNGFNNFYVDEYRNRNGGANTLISSASIPIHIRTRINDFGTLNLKTCSRFGIIASIEDPSATATALVSWTDDSFNSFSTAVSLPITPGMDFPFSTQAGKFRQRAWKIVYGASYSIVFKGFEMDINKASQ